MPRDIRRSFDEVADVYDRVRPRYPSTLFDALFTMLPAEPEIVEVGPGTGQATRDLIGRGATVHAIELGRAMASRLRANLPSPSLRVSVGDFESVDLAPGSVDGVFSATAYHWISPAARADRPATVLRQGGTVAIVDLVQVDSPDDGGFFAAAQPIYDRYGRSHTGPPAPTRRGVDPPIRAVFESDSRFGDVTVRRYDWNQSYAAAEFRDLMLTYSSTRMMDEPDRRGLVDDIETLVRQEFGGIVTRPVVVALTTAVLR